MFDIGWQELFIVAILAIIVIGPKDLPRAVRTVMRAIRKLRSMAGEFQSGLDEVAREAELDDIRREANKIAHYDLDGAVRETMTEAKTTSAADAPVTAAPPPPSEPVTTAEPAPQPAADTAKT